jgi:hypothetical protein
LPLRHQYKYIHPLLFCPYELTLKVDPHGEKANEDDLSIDIIALAANLNSFLVSKLKLNIDFIINQTKFSFF